MLRSAATTVSRQQQLALAGARRRPHRHHFVRIRAFEQSSPHAEQLASNTTGVVDTLRWRHSTVTTVSSCLGGGGTVGYDTPVVRHYSSLSARTSCTPVNATITRHDKFKSNMTCFGSSSSLHLPLSHQLSHQRRPYIFLPSTPSELYHAIKSWLSDLFAFGGSLTSANDNNKGRMQISVKLRNQLGDQYSRLREKRRAAVARFGRRGRDHLYASTAVRERYTTHLRTIRDRWRSEGRRRFDDMRARRQVLRVSVKEALKRRRMALRDGFLLTEANRIQGRASFRYQRAKARVKAKILARLNTAVRRTKRFSSLAPAEAGYSKHVFVLDEPAKKSWFDPDGYPQTARDPLSGRFVNPWNSESTNGQHDLADLWRWRVGRRLNGGGAGAGAGEKNLLVPGDCDDDDDVALEHVRRTIYGETPSISHSSDDVVAALVDRPSSESNIKLTWLGHSTSLVQMMGFNLLTDPMFSNRASALQVFGPARYTKPALGVDDLPSLDLVLISHDHYDHLDYNSVLDLVESNKVKYWAVPLGIKAWLMDHTHLDADRIVELEWWEGARFAKSSSDSSADDDLRLVGTGKQDDGGSDIEMTHADQYEMKITCAPSQHWCGRTMFDRNRRLWCSWAVRTRKLNVASATLPSTSMSKEELNFYFAGDSGLPPAFPLHRQIGDRLGPFDLSAIPIGAYKPSFFMRDSHVDPHEALAIHHAVRSKRSVGVHWGTFALADERYDEPPRLLKKAVQDFNSEAADFVTIRLGGSIESPPSPMNRNADERQNVEHSESIAEKQCATG